MQALVEEIPEIKNLTGHFCTKPIEIHIQKLKLSLSSTNFVFYPNNHLVTLQILSY